MKIREKRQKSGRLLEVDFYYVTETGRRMNANPSETKPSREQQKKYNDKQAVKKLIRKVNENFDRSDCWMSITFKPTEAPQSRDELQKTLRNYFRRYKTWREREAQSIKAEIKELQPLTKTSAVAGHVKDLKSKLKAVSREMKYAYVTQCVKYRTGAYAGRCNWHVHLFLTGAGKGDRDVLQKLWTSGDISADRFNPDLYGPETAAKYMARSAEGVRKYVFSHNCREPSPPKIIDGKTTALQLDRMAKLRVDDREFWERRHKGYRLMRCIPRVNPYNGKWYITVLMWQDSEEPPTWILDDWADTEG